MRKVIRYVGRLFLWLLIFSVICFLFVKWFVPFAKWLFVNKTLEVYSEVQDKYSNDEESTILYQGEIIDTVIQPSLTRKGKIDTVVHHKSIKLDPNGTSASDGKPKLEDVGTFGDGAGLLNAFFSFLAFMAVLATIYLQSKKDDSDKRSNARVQFEQEFFAMVGMLEDIVAHLRFTDTIPVKSAPLTDEIVKKLGYQNNNQINNDGALQNLPQKIIEGREVFRYIYKDRGETSLISYVNKEESGSYNSEEAQAMCFDGTLDHYFRYLYRILKHIDKSELLKMLDNPKAEREKYAHLLRAQLSNYELLMWFYNGLLGENPKTIKVLIEKYAMFNNLRAGELDVHRCDYYQAILDEEKLYDSKGIDMQTTYSVTAFWDNKKLKELRKKEKKPQREGHFFVVKWCRKIESWFSENLGGFIKKCKKNQKESTTESEQETERKQITGGKRKEDSEKSRKKKKQKKGKQEKKQGENADHNIVSRRTKLKEIVGKLNKDRTKR